jgi:putative tryptophan/tyrosine transport system substrate-binding protein
MAYGGPMRRREFITLLGSVAAAWPLVARSQSIPVIGYLSSGTPTGFAPLLAAFRDGLSESGYVEGRNIAIEFRWSEGQDQRLPAFVADLIRHKTAIIVATGGSAPASAAKAATTTIPIVFTGGQDPVRLGLVQSLNRPGGNATGVLNIALVLTGKRLELLRELVPTAGMIAVLVNPNRAGSTEQLTDLVAAANGLGQKIEVFDVYDEAEFDSTFAKMVRQDAGALYITSDPFFTSRTPRLVALAAQHSMPTSYSFRSFAVAGGLMTYGASLTDQHRQAGVYAGRILKGAKPADLPVLLPTKFDFVINLKTAMILGLKVPEKLLALADQVIE